MSFVQVKLIEEAFMPTDKTEIVTTPSQPSPHCGAAKIPQLWTSE
jgi:hypothetical protein